LRIDVSGQKFVFPNVCACCNGKAEAELTISASKSKGKRVVHTTTLCWPISYCARCVNHIRAIEAAAFSANVLVFLSLLVAALVWYSVGAMVGFIAALLGIVASQVTRNKLTTQARAMCGPDCACAKRAVSYLGWHGTLHQFEFTSADFARRFMEDNQRKLVNLTPEARQLLTLGGSKQLPNAPRAPSRYMS
jgi:hypothetical protein